MLDALWLDVAPFTTAQELETAEYPGPFSDLDVSTAVAIVRGLCGWHIAPVVPLTFELNSDGSEVMELPSYNIGEPTAVKDGRGPDAADIEGWTWSRNGLLGLPRCGRPQGLANIVVTAPSGLATVPSDLLAVVADIARTRGTAAARPIGLKSRTIGGVSYTYADTMETSNGAASAGPYARYAPILSRFTL
ncbi:hypothetical protein [Nocardia phage NBR1]|uniref:hypothetical protein n=1 Tax=Nocardia phage NBR1 TaxID=1109711 RepID=UPI00023EED9C|nr:hypothetical protein NoPhNBR1_gp10 [Nocardia phage NBR1]AEV52223.1 hypothetical protein [Nocardia phage NBR1]